MSELVTGKETLDELAMKITRWRARKSFVTGWFNFPEKVALMHSELSEALEEHRLQKDGYEKRVYEELIDCMIRILDFLGWTECDVNELMKKVMAENELRPKKHNKQY